MTGGLSTAVLITLVGMGLVFAVILVFWVLMSLLTRWTSDKPAGSAAKDPAGERELKRRAALAAVSVALVMDAEERPGVFPAPPTAVISTWQAVMRARQLGRRRSVQ